MNNFKITLINKKTGVNQIISVSDQEYILDAIEGQGICVPQSCKAGTCSSCVGKIYKGHVDQSDQGFLDEDQLNDGYVLMCVAYPKSDCIIQTHAEDDLY